MRDHFQEYLSKNPDSAEKLEQFRIFLAESGRSIAHADSSDIEKYRDKLSKTYGATESVEHLLVVSAFYRQMNRKAVLAQYIRNILILLVQVFAIYASSVWIIPKYQWPSFLWLDQLSILMFGSQKIFYLPGFLGSLITLFAMLVLVARGWLERPRNWLGWIILILDWWILAVLYGLVVGDEAAFLSGGLPNLLIVVAFSAFVLGFREIVGLAFIVLMVLSGFRITEASSIIIGMSLPYLLSLTILIFAQCPDAFDRVLSWINAQFLSGKAQATSSEIVKSATLAATAIQRTAGLAVGKLALPKKTKMLD